jgi:hypothetical protein
MAGAQDRYADVSHFHPDVFDFGSVVGNINKRPESRANGKQKCAEGIVYFLMGSRIRGVLVRNLLDKVDVMRALIGNPLASLSDRQSITA